MTKEELKFLMTHGFTISELLEMEQGAPDAADPPAPKPETKPSESDNEKPETAQKTPDETVSVSKPDNEPDPSAAKIAALEAQIGLLQAQVLAQATTQPGGSTKTVEDLVADF